MKLSPQKVPRSRSMAGAHGSYFVAPATQAPYKAHQSMSLCSRRKLDHGIFAPSQLLRLLISEKLLPKGPASLLREKVIGTSARSWSSTALCWFETVGAFGDDPKMKYLLGHASPNTQSRGPPAHAVPLSGRSSPDLHSSLTPPIACACQTHAELHHGHPPS